MRQAIRYSIGGNPTSGVNRAKNAERDIAASAARSATVQPWPGCACTARNAATSRLSESPRATLGAEAVSAPHRSASISSTSSRRSSTSSRPGRDRRVSSLTKFSNCMSRGSPRAMTIDGNNETGKAALGEAKLHTADLHPEIDLIVRWSDAKPSLAELRRRHGDPLWGRVDALDDLIVSRGRQHKVSCAYDDQRRACT